MLRKARAALWCSEFVIVHEFHKPPYGGGNQFLLALRRELLRQGYDIGRNRIGRRTRTVLFNSFNFDFEALRKSRRPGLRMVHRVDGPISVYRGTEDEIDRRIWQINHELADATIFQSRYSLEKHREMKMQFQNPTIIHNAADPGIFHPAAGVHSGVKGRKIRLVSSSWSDNPRKGADVLRWLDEHLDFGRYEYTFVGRCRAAFRNIRHVPAVPSKELADILRANDVFLAVSLNDPCSNALIEALSCGLPAVYHESGGNAELAQDAGIGFSEADEIPDCLERIASGYEDFRGRIKAPSIEVVARDYLQALSVESSVSNVRSIP
jgi:glycosyltransferase involved in cell wall biosynthesis